MSFGAKEQRSRSKPSHHPSIYQAHSSSCNTLSSELLQVRVPQTQSPLPFSHPLLYYKKYMSVYCQRLLLSFQATAANREEAGISV